MKILQISNYLYPVIGGIERVAEDAAHFFAEAGIEQKIICFHEDPGGGLCRSDKIETVNGVEVIRCGCVAKLMSQSVSLSMPRLLHEVLESFQPDIVIFHYPNPYPAFFLLHSKVKFRLIVWWHSDIVKNPLVCRLVRRQNLRLISRADRIVGATPVHLSESAFASCFPEEKKRLVPYTVGQYRIGDTLRFDGRAAELRRKYAGKTLCLFVGRHVAYKGLRHLIEAAKLLDDGYVFVIAGEGPLTEELKSLAGEDARLHFVGTIPEEEKLSHMKACDIFCFPSVTENENFGLALAEAMYFGKSAVTFTIPRSGVNCVSVNGVTGIECPNADSAAFAGAIETLAKDDALRKRYGSAAQERIINNFSDECFREGLMALVKELGEEP